MSLEEELIDTTTEEGKRRLEEMEKGEGAALKEEWIDTTTEEGMKRLEEMEIAEDAAAKEGGPSTEKYPDPE